MTFAPLRLRASLWWIVLVAAASAASCQRQGESPGSTMSATAGSTGAAGDDGAAPGDAGPTSTDATTNADATAPGESDVAEPRPVNQEEDAAPPSVDAIAMTEATQKILEGLAAQVEGARVVFVDCTVSPCTARVTAPTLAALRTFLVAISDAFHGRISFVARERFDGFTGHVFEADVVLDTDKPRPVPASEDELLNPP